MQFLAAVESSKRELTEIPYVNNFQTTQTQYMLFWLVKGAL